MHKKAAPLFEWAANQDVFFGYCSVSKTPSSGLSTKDIRTTVMLNTKITSFTVEYLKKPAIESAIMANRQAINETGNKRAVSSKNRVTLFIVS